MAFEPVNFDNINETFDKNGQNLMDMIQFGILFQTMKMANDDASGEYKEYSEEDRSALGLSDNLTNGHIAGVMDETCNVHMPAGENPYDSFKYIVYGVEKATNRTLLEHADLYNQILDSLPEDEPDREDKAMYLLKQSGLNDPSYFYYLSDLEDRATKELQKPYLDILDGKNHNGNWKEATIGEVLDSLGFDEAQKQEFIRKHDYESVDDKLYEREIRRNEKSAEKVEEIKTLEDDIKKLEEDIKKAETDVSADKDAKKKAEKDLEEKITDLRTAENSIWSNVKSYLSSSLITDARSSARETLEKEMPPEEKDAVKAFKEKMPKINDGGDQEKIDAWIREKGGKLGDDLKRARIAATAQKTRLLLESGKSLSSINADAPLKDSLENQKEGNAYVGQLIKGEKNISQVLTGLIENGKKKLPGLEYKSAKEFIDEVKTELREKPEEINDDDHPYKQFATVFAARILANSKRGSKASLGETFSRLELDEVAEKLQNNQDFIDFINETYLDENDENLTKLKNAEQRLYSARTHGGFIEDEFKKFLLKKKPGELENSPELARFMPTARERIEELKRQVKKSPDDRDLQRDAAAEIIAIRNACKVERKTGYGLDKQIPPAGKDERINKEVEKMSGDDHLNYILRDDNTRRDLLAMNSHGGKMMINVRKEYDDQVEQNNRDPKIVSSLKKNTVGSRMQELCDEAKKTGIQLGSKVKRIRDEAMQKSKEILGEYMTLVCKAVKPQGMVSDVPWKSAGQLAQSTVTDPTAGKIMESPEKASAMMAAIGSGDMKVFRNKLNQEMEAVNAPKQQAPENVRENAQEREQNGPEFKDIGLS